MGNSNIDIWRLLSKCLPKSLFFDNVFATIKFLRVHRRFPQIGRDSFNDKLFQVKATEEILNPLRTFTTDKEYFKIFVRSTVGEAHVVPTVAILRSKEEVDNFVFPKNFCVKPTHTSGDVIISKNDEFDINRIKSWFDEDHYQKSRERNYKYLKPKVIVEPIIFDNSDITDFRIYCYNGVAKLIGLDIGKYSKYRRVFFTTEWERQSFSLGYPLYEGRVDRPENLSAMISVAEQMSVDLNFVRVDFYTNGSQFFLSELTHCHASASQRFSPPEAEEIASDIIFSKQKV